LLVIVRFEVQLLCCVVINKTFITYQKNCFVVVLLRRCRCGTLDQLLFGALFWLIRRATFIHTYRL
jgi:hypothetical protein